MDIALLSITEILYLNNLFCIEQKQIDTPGLITCMALIYAKSLECNVDKVKNYHTLNACMLKICWLKSYIKIHTLHSNSSVQAS